MNAIEFNRDLTRSVGDVRASERHLSDKPDRGRGTVTLPEMRRARIGLCVATQIARVEHEYYSPVFGWRSPEQAWAMTQAQAAWYTAMEEKGEMTAITDLVSLERHLARWETESSSSSDQKTPVGYILSLEGADSILSVRHLEQAVERGLRAIGPAHYGPGIFANGTDATGGFNPRGRDLLREIARLGLILDVTHLSDQCFWEALELFEGPLWASHHNSRALVPHNRHLSDEMVRALVARDAVIGVALDAWMLVPGWQRGKTTPQSAGVTLQHFVDHIDHHCQIAGNARHVGFGTDLDGAYGTEQTPQDLDTIADLTRVPDLLRKRGFSEEDVAGIAHGNFLRFLRRHWAEN